LSALGQRRHIGPFAALTPVAIPAANDQITMILDQADPGS
jgi:hypothetical protein